MKLTYKIIVVGDSQAGKTTFCDLLYNALRLGELDETFPLIQPESSTMVNINHLYLNTSIGKMRLTLVDIPESINKKLFDYYTCGSDGCIIMCDASKYKSYINVYKWEMKIKKTCPTIPILFGLNKIDIKDPSISEENYHELTILNRPKYITILDDLLDTIINQQLSLDNNSQ